MSKVSDSPVFISPDLIDRLSSVLTSNKDQSITEQINFEKQNICDTFGKLEDEFQGLLDRIFQNIENGEVFQSCFLENALEIIEITSEMIKSILKYIEHESNFIELGCNSLPNNAFNLVLLSYKHCKTSQTSYKNHFNEAAHLLGELFRKTFNLQKMLGLLLGKFCAFTIKSKRLWQLKDIELVLTSLCDISAMVNEMDKSLIATSWKMFISFLIQLKEMLSENINISKFIGILQNNIREYFQEVIQLNKEISNELVHDPMPKHKFMISYKMVNFFLEILTSLTDNYGITDCKCDEICAFLFEIFSNISSIITNSTNYFALGKGGIKLEPILNKLDKVIFKVLILHSFKPFKDKICSSTEQEKSQIAVLMFLTRVVAIIVKLNCTKQLGKVHVDVINIHFQTVTPCFNEIHFAHTIRIDDNNIRIYNQFCTNLCALVIAIPEELFHNLEVILIENLLSVQSYKSTLAADVWCFMARFSSGEVCLDHIKLLIGLVKLIGNNFPILSVISRLIGFLEEEQRALLLNLCPFNNEENLALWAHCGHQLTSLCNKPSSIFKEICEKCTCVLNRWIESGCEISSLLLVINYIKILSSIFYDGDAKLISLCQSYISSLVFVLIRLWKSLPVESDEIIDGLLTLYSELLNFNTQLITTCDDIEDLANMTQMLLDVSLSKTKQLFLSCKNSSSTQKYNFYSTIVNFLLSLKSKVLTTDAQGILAYLWQNIIQESNEDWYLRFNTLDSFEMFLATTKHPNLMTEICSITKTADLVKSHLRRNTIPLPKNVTIDGIVTNFAIKSINQDFDPMEISNEDLQDTNTSGIVKTLERNVTDLKRIPFAKLTEIDIFSIKKCIKDLENFIDP